MIDIVEHFQAAARAMDDKETAVRREANERIAVLELARAHAYRRLDFVTGLDEAACTATDHPEAVVKQQRVLLDRFGWPAFDSAPRLSIRAAILPLFEAIASVHHAIDPVSDDQGASASETDIFDHLALFETWYQDAFKSDFWTLSDT